MAANIVSLISDKLARVPAIYMALTPLRITLANLDNVDKSHQKYFDFLKQRNYVVRTGGKYSSNIKAVELLKDKDLIRELKLTILVPYIGISKIYYELAIEMDKNIALPKEYLYRLYKSRYSSSISFVNFCDKLQDLEIAGILNVKQKVKGNYHVTRKVLGNNQKQVVQAQL